MVKLFSKNSNLCDHNSPTLQTDRQTDRQTTCNRNTALCTKVHRAVKTWFILHNNTMQSRRYIGIYCAVFSYRLLFCTESASKELSKNSVYGNEPSYNNTMYRVVQKSKPQSYVHIFAKYWPIFTLFSLVRVQFDGFITENGNLVVDSATHRVTNGDPLVGRLSVKLSVVSISIW